MTLLTIVNSAQRKLSMPVTTAVTGNTDPNVRMMLEAAQEELVHLARRCAWQALTTEKTFTSVAQASQTDAVPSDFDYIVNETMYNRSQKRRVVGPLNAREWQGQQALTAQILTDAFRIRGGNILITPTPDAGDTYAYEYVTKNRCQDSGGTGQELFAQDSDVALLDEELMKVGVEWRYLAKRKLPYAEEFATYEYQVEQAVGRDGGRRTIDYSNTTNLFDDHPYPIVTEGNWSLT